MEELEKLRAATQKSIDDSKTKVERNKLGQYATPRLLADELLAYAKSLTGNRKVKFIDPAFGTGSFYTACINAYGNNCTGVGFEIDEAYYKGAFDVWKDTPSLTIKNADFTKEVPKDYRPFDLLVCNPPYSRHHHLNNDTKQRIQAMIKASLGFKVSGLAGLHFYFMLLAHEWMAENGIGIWLVPSEIVEVNYGKYIRKYLLENVDLLRIHFFEQSDVQFDDALVSSCVIVFKKASAKADSMVHVTVGDFAAPTAEYRTEKSGLPVDKKWSKHMLTHPHNAEATTNSAPTKLGELFNIKRGIATGDNGFFILDRDKAEALAIPRQYLQNIVPSSRHLKGDVIKLDKDGYLDTEKQLVLLNISLPLDEIKAKYPKLHTYLQEGIARGVNKGYLASKRNPWYSQEQRHAPKYFVRYMNRERKVTTENSMIFIKNESDAIATNSYLMLYEKPKELFASEYDDSSIWRYLAKGLDRSLYRFGRTYGGGLVKFEPSELRELPLMLVGNS